MAGAGAPPMRKARRARLTLLELLVSFAIVAKRL